MSNKIRPACLTYGFWGCTLCPPTRFDILLFFVSLWKDDSARAPAPSTCPNPKTSEVDLEAYSGTWYEIGSTAQFKARSEKDLACVTARYSVIPDGELAGKVRVRNGGYNISSGTDTFIIGYASVVSRGRLAVTFFPGAPAGDYRVIYLQGKAKNGYEVAIVYSCADTNAGISQGLFILSRTPTLPRTHRVEDLLDYVSDQGIDLETANKLVLTSQDPIICGRNFDQ